jgi:hypothetical protein
MTILKYMKAATLVFALSGLGSVPAWAWIPHSVTCSTNTVSFHCRSVSLSTFDQAENLIQAAAAGQAARRQVCLPDGSSIALFTRQAFDQGRESEGRDYGRFVEELAHISSSPASDDDKVGKSMTAAINFARSMRARGHDLGVRDLIIDRETSLTYRLREGNTISSITRAHLEGQRAVIREMKRLMCR